MKKLNEKDERVKRVRRFKVTSLKKNFNLSERELQCLVYRYGFVTTTFGNGNQGEVSSLSQVAEWMDISRQRVHCLEQNALLKLGVNK